MTRRIRRSLFLMLAAAVLAAAHGASPARAQELDQVVAGLEATYGKITDLRGEFTQVANNKSLGQDIKAEGTVHLKKGGKMRWTTRARHRSRSSPTGRCSGSIRPS